ncbi:tail fiber protein [Hyphobacterium sp. CCMP332]|nr:tail fiber protein [Hyphobacterium sp. CCMP332]
MKNLVIILSILLTYSSLFAQAPENFSYQAVIRDANNDLVTNSAVSLRMSILQGSSTGTAEYVETHSVSTNDNGLISIAIGGGNVVSGNISTIDWTQGPYFIQSEVDPTGGSTYTISGTSQLLSVPYAIRASSANESDPLFSSSIAAGISASDTTNWGSENDPIFSSSVASGISSSDTASWNSKLDSEVDGSITNELQSLSKTGSTVTLSNGGGSFNDDVNVYTGGNGINVSGSNEISINLSEIFPTGMIMPFAGDTSQIPNGWLVCHGQAIDRSTYPDLFNTLGVIWGGGNGTTTFNVPDLRGRFLRGKDFGSGNDPDASTRTSLFPLGSTGDNVGSYQNDEFLNHNHGGGNHTHTIRGVSGSSNGGVGSIHTNTNNTNPFSTVDGFSFSGNILNTNGGSETRPINAYVNYIIKD